MAIVDLIVPLFQSLFHPYLLLSLLFCLYFWYCGTKGRKELMKMSSTSLSAHQGASFLDCDARNKNVQYFWFKRERYVLSVLSNFLLRNFLCIIMYNNNIIITFFISIFSISLLLVLIVGFHFYSVEGEKLGEFLLTIISTLEKESQILQTVCSY